MKMKKITLIAVAVVVVTGAGITKSHMPLLLSAKAIFQIR